MKQQIIFNIKDIRNKYIVKERERERKVESERSGSRDD